MKSSSPKLIKGKHPLVVLREMVSLEQLYKALGQKNHTTISSYSNKAAKNKKLTIPAEWCLTISKFTGWKLSDLRPDVYLPDHEGPKLAAVKEPPRAPLVARTRTVDNDNASA